MLASPPETIHLEAIISIVLRNINARTREEKKKEKSVARGMQTYKREY
jgi:hypothetical protein